MRMLTDFELSEKMIVLKQSLAAARTFVFVAIEETD